jgi:transcriptional regulator with XRE-family HTH domain
MSSTFGMTLTAFRKRARLSQPKLANACGCDHSYVSRMELGQRHPSPEMVDKLAGSLALSDHDAEQLYRSAGYIGPLSEALNDPLAVRVQSLMQDEKVRSSYRMMAMQVISAIVTEAH